jgi:energy-coupling factor transporter ATP-binding protein EcfA2
MVKLRWLQVNKFRSVKQGTRLTFNDGHNVLLGQNGTGKTTLLNLVAAAIKSNFADFKDEEFDVSYELVSEEAAAAIWVRNENRTLPIPSALENISHRALRFGGPTSESGLRAPVLSVMASLSSKQTDLQVDVRIEGKRGVAQRMDEQPPGPPVELDYSLAENWPAWMLIASGLSQWSQRDSAPLAIPTGLFELFFEFTATRFDESLEYFNKLGELHYELYRHNDGHISAGGPLTDDVLLDRLSSLAQTTWGVDRYVLTDTELQFLKNTIQFLDFESAEAIVELKDTTKHTQVDIMRLGNLRFYFTHRGGWKISEKMLSYGQKRMLAFMHYLDTAKSVVIADELVNGLHHRWIRACFEALGQRQVFLTSQNPLLLDYLNFQSPKDVRSTFVLCSWEKDPERMAWENMTQEAAEDFFASYKVGFQQVGELLQSKGLW